MLWPSVFRNASLALLLAACASPDYEYGRTVIAADVAADSYQQAEAQAAAHSVVELTPMAGEASAAASVRDAAGAATTNRLLVQRGELQLEVPRPEEAVQSVLSRLPEWEGFLQQQSGTTLTIRVPAERFESVFATLRGMGRVLRELRGAEDVTEEYLDLGLRIENAKRSLERLRELMQRAEKVEDLLKIEQEVRRLSEEIERLEGRRRFLASRVAMATLQVGFRAVTAPPDQPRSRQPSRFGWLNAIGPEYLLEDF